MENVLIGKWSNWKEAGSVARSQKEKNTVSSEQLERWVEDYFHPLQQRPNDKKFKHENW